jgi:hypothetical protein
VAINSIVGGGLARGLACGDLILNCHCTRDQLPTDLLNSTLRFMVADKASAIMLRRGNICLCFSIIGRSSYAGEIQSTGVPEKSAESLKLRRKFATSHMPPLTSF